MNRNNRLIVLLALSIYVIALLSACGGPNENETTASITLPAEPVITTQDTTQEATTQADTSQDAFLNGFGGSTYSETEDNYGNYNVDVPAFGSEPYYVINENKPYFDQAEMSTSSFEYYSDLDELGRCGTCYACIGQDIMPTEKRGEIGQIKPTGWQTAKYDFVDGKYLYNRCHLIGFQLAGENANEKNLITGTRYLNVVGMLPFENQVADYVKSTGNHVMYRVAPVFNGNELVARGVVMEGYSVEDNGQGVCFNVYCYNVQPGVEIDYATGENREWDSTQSSSSGDDSYTTSVESDYVLNTNSKKFHNPNCEAADKISAKNKQDYHGTREALIEQGYEACGACKP